MSLKDNGEAADRSGGGNDLIDALPPRQREAVLALCEPIELSVGTALCEAGESFEYAYFPITGTISLVNLHRGRQPFETQSIGYQGMLGATLILDMNDAPQRGIVQTPCQALRMTPEDLQAALQSNPALFRIVQRYLFIVLAELLQAAACVHFHDVGARLARSLLLAHDRAPEDDVPMTHQSLAAMLGVQRGAVTIAAIKLQREGIIHYSRGKISILDRKGLEAKSCECYGACIENHASLLS